MPGKKMTLAHQLEAAQWMREHAKEAVEMTPDELAEALFDHCSFDQSNRPNAAAAARIRKAVGIAVPRKARCPRVPRTGPTWTVKARLERIERHLGLPEIYPAVPSETQE